MIGYSICFKVRLNLMVQSDVSKTENKFLCVTFQLISNVFYFFQQLVNVYLICQNERIKAPNNATIAKRFNNSFKCLYSLDQRWHTALKFFIFIIIQGKLYIATYTTFLQLFKMIKKRTWIL